ncbi:MAG: hypothetical protein P1P77_07940 [Spirochaetaceae bacterium]|nr:hypothetical protein [Spirochaetaceae bacterium]
MSFSIIRCWRISPRHLNRVLHELKTAGVIGSGYPGVRIRSLEEINRLIE